MTTLDYIEKLPFYSLEDSKINYISPKNQFQTIMHTYAIICNLPDIIYGSKFTIYDVSYRVIYSKYMTHNKSYVRVYATSHSLSQRNGHVAGVYFDCIGHVV